MKITSFKDRKIISSLSLEKGIRAKMEERYKVTQKAGMYGMIGNIWEWTLEYTSDSSDPCASRGGDYSVGGRNIPAVYRDYIGTTYYDDGVGFRGSLY